MTNIEETIQEIRHALRRNMSGPTAQAMRDRGVDYKINWGVPFYQLKAIAADYQQDLQLANALWSHPVREMRILALLLMPAEACTLEQAMTWIEQSDSQELVEIGSISLYVHINDAALLAKQCLESNEPFKLICALSICSRKPELQTTETTEKARMLLNHENMAVKHSAYNFLLRTDAEF